MCNNVSTYSRGFPTADFKPCISPVYYKGSYVALIELVKAVRLGWLLDQGDRHAQPLSRG
jgi:hypothetical protein